MDDHGSPPRDRAGGSTAFVLAGGGSLGSVQVGMLLALAEAGIRPDMVIGASVGAINAAYFAGSPTVEGVRRLADIWAGLRRRDVFPFAPVRGALGALNRRNSLLRPAALRALILRTIPYHDLSQAEIPCHVVATDVLGGEEIRLSSGAVVEALLASTAIPALFPPVLIGGRLLMDGAVGSNAPVATAVALGASRIIILPTGFTCAAAQPPGGAIGLALHSVSLMTARQLRTDIARFQGRVSSLAVVPPLCPLRVSVYDFSQARLLIDRTARSTSEWLTSGGLERSEVPMALLPHAH